MEKIRSFIAIELSEEIRKELVQIQDELKAVGADVKWVKPENIHLTLKFLGSVEDDRLSTVKAVLDKIASNYKRFRISLFKVGCFPKLDYPRVIWVGIDRGCADVEEIAAKLERELGKLGFEKEKRSFSAHLTLGRVRSAKERNKLVQKIKALEFQSSAGMNVTELTLFKSTLTPNGPIYAALHKAALSCD